MVAVPVATWTPWVNRYPQAGRAGSGSQDHGSYWYRLRRPVTSEMLIAMASTRPRRAVSAVERTVLLKAGHHRGRDATEPSVGPGAESLPGTAVPGGSTSGAPYVSAAEGAALVLRGDGDVGRLDPPLTFDLHRLTV